MLSRKAGTILFRAVVAAVVVVGASWCLVRLFQARREHFASGRLRELGAPVTEMRWGGPELSNRLGRFQFWLPYDVIQANIPQRDPAAGLKLVKSFGSLWRLDATGCNLSDDQVADLRVPHLKYLDLSMNLELTGTTLGTLPFLKELEYLDLSITSVGDEGLRQLQGATSLRELRLFNTKVTDDGLAYLTRLPQLEKLSVFSLDDQITDVGLLKLAQCPKLMLLRLDVDGDHITKRGVATLRQLMPACEIGNF